ncbi:MAG: methylated-DNA--[protein]-cysteine S-methyltransferase [Proteobacteria bacterium]|jgi:O-6-methylguanine DNA methyltransferase|nr:methylated-DNA--[protein]-cysteine S-methyltransferase [Alphaproteobacteria bacterium]NCC02809.1 methylated-DNA--[protein]-cysteine S-methyltransferase [Pseudomonadota bacterium]
MLTLTSQAPATVFVSAFQDKRHGPLLLGFTPEGLVCRTGFLHKENNKKDILALWQKGWPTTVFSQKRAAPFQSLAPLPPVLLVGTAFQHKVWQALLTIKTGQTISYGELARRIKKPKAVRAVGTALGKNPVPVLLPCHRVIASNGSLGGFTGGLSLKKKLLEIEGHPAPYPLRLSR